MNSLVGKSDRAEMPNLELRAKLEKYLSLSNLTLGIPTLHPNSTSKVHLLLLRWELHKFVVSKVDQLREKQLQKLIMNAWSLSKLIVKLKKLSKNTGKAGQAELQIQVHEKWAREWDWEYCE